MKKTIFYAALGLSLVAASCKENVEPTTSNTGTISGDSTYVEAVQAAEPRRILIEELTGVQCPNCPEGADALEALKEQNDGMAIVSFHTGVLSDPYPESKQKLQNADGRIFRSSVWGGDPAGYPAIVLDRGPFSNIANKLYIENASTWSNAVAQDKTTYPATSPVNMSINSKYNESKDQYDIEVIVKYTQDVSIEHALHIMLTQDNITDIQLTKTEKIPDYVFKHVYRKTFTDIKYGTLIKPVLASNVKEAGRVYIYRTSLKIDPTDELQQYWKAEDMDIVAFVTVANNPSDIHTIQSQHAKLKQ